jgi:hypothetical protein
MSSATRVPRLFRRWRPEAPVPRRLWALASATTADGVVAHVQLDFTLRVRDDGTAAGPEELDRAAMEAVENALRHWIAAHPVSDMPVAGETVGWVPSDLVDDALVENVFVTACDVEVTSQLRRLLVGCAGP